MEQDNSTAGRLRRLATLGALAKPVQHEINNLLTVVFANLELLKRTAAEGPPQRQLDRIEQAARRLEGSTRAILSLSRRAVPEPTSFAPAEALRQLAPLLQLALPGPGALALTLPEGEAWKITADRALFDETMLLLAREAALGMPRGASLLLRLTQEAGAVALTIHWPEAAPSPDPALAEMLAALGVADWQRRWPRAEA